MSGMIARRFGEDPRKEARAESNETVNRERRYAQIIECLTERGPSTAKEIAVWMQLEGLIPTSERNYASPRLTEMCEKGITEPVGKTKCWYTGRTVTVYDLVERD